jgi:multicomponent Na+:H+ antiporter subunit D
MIVLLVIVPLMTAFLLSLTAVPHRVTHKTLMRIRTGLSVTGFSILFIVLGVSAPAITAGTVYTYTLGGWHPFLGIALQMDALSFLIAVVSVFVCFLGMVYSFSYMEHIRGMGKYDASYFLMVAGILGVLITRDIFNMYVFFEILGIAVYVLITTGQKKENYKASLKYLILGSLSSALFLFAVGIVYGITGSLNMDYAAAGINAATQGDPAVYMVAALLFVSLGVKAGIVPLHFWLPDAHSLAPSPVSALLSGIVLKVSLYSIIRLFFLIDYQIFLKSSPFIAYAGGATVIVGTVLALTQSNVKRMLAYSSISQIGIIVIGIGIGTNTALTGALFHIVNHALMKSGLFFCTGIIIHQSRTRDITHLHVKTPGIAAAFTVFALGIVGIPPLNGFASKFCVLYGAIQAGYYVLAVVILAASVIACGYYFRVVQVFFGAKKIQKRSYIDIPLLVRTPVYILAVMCVVLGVFPLIGLSAAALAAAVVGG